MSRVEVAKTYKLFIGGEWVAATSGREIEIINPNTEEPVARVAEASEADMDRAVAAARQAFDHGPWPTTPPAERGRKLMEISTSSKRAFRNSPPPGRRRSAASPASRR